MHFDHNVFSNTIGVFLALIAVKMSTSYSKLFKEKKISKLAILLAIRVALTLIAGIVLVVYPLGIFSWLVSLVLAIAAFHVVGKANK